MDCEEEVLERVGAGTGSVDDDGSGSAEVLGATALEEERAGFPVLAGRFGEPPKVVFEELRVGFFNGCQKTWVNVLPNVQGLAADADRGRDLGGRVAQAHQFADGALHLRGQLRGPTSEVGLFHSSFSVVG